VPVKKNQLVKNGDIRTGYNVGWSRTNL